MRSNLGFIKYRSKVMLAHGPSSDVVLTWREWSGPVTTDLTDGSKTGTSVEKSETVKGFVHMISPATSGVRIFAEVEIGDCIVDFDADVVLEGREGLTFSINGEQWMPKQVGDKLGQTWDVTVKGIRFFRSVLLRKAN